MRNKIILITTLVLVASVLAFLSWSKFGNQSPQPPEGENQVEQPKSYGFDGNIVRTNGNILAIRGTYNVQDQSFVQSDMIDVEVEVGPDTKITRIALEIPLTSEPFNPDNLPKQESIADLATLIADSNRTTIGLIIKTSEDIFGKKKFLASEITYRVPILPDR